MSLKIDEYLSSTGIMSATLSQGTTATEQMPENAKQQGDSYISSVSNADEAIPCENYNDILQVIKSAKAEESQADTSSEHSDAATAEPETAAVSGGNGGSGGSSDSEDETTTEIVTINGVTYLETTTVSNGVKTVTWTEISG